MLRRAVLRGAHLALQVGAVATDTDEDGASLIIVEQVQRVHAPGVDLLQIVADQGLQTTEPRDGLSHRVGRLGVTEVEAVEPVCPVLRAGRDLVELVLHGRGEVVVHQRGERRLEQADDGECDPAGHQGTAPRVDVAAILDGLDDRRVRRRAPDTEVLHLLHQRRLGVAGGRIRGVAFGGDVRDGQVVALVQPRELLLGVVRHVAAVRLAGHLHIGLEETGERDGAAGCGELARRAVVGGSGDGHLHRGSPCIRHLGGDGALPDQLVELELLGVQLTVQLARRGESLASGADGLVRLLRILGLPGVLTRRIRDVVAAVELHGLRAGGLDARCRQRGGVGTHVGDVAVLVQALRDAHGAVRGVVELTSGLLLERGRHERRVRAPGVGLLLHPGDGHGGLGEPVGELSGTGLVDDDDGVALQCTTVVEVAAGGHPGPVDTGQPGGEHPWIGAVRVRIAGVELRGDVPVVRGDERHALALTLDDDSGGDGLDTPGGQPGHDLLPQHG